MCDPVHICLTSNPCQNGATCNINTKSNTDYTCSCPPNYSGQTCDRKLADKCVLSVTVKSRYIINFLIFLECVLSCLLGYEPSSACECDPVHICLTSNPCQNGATCVIGTNSNTNYTCSCPSNFFGDNCTDDTSTGIKLRNYSNIVTKHIFL